MTKEEFHQLLKDFCAVSGLPDPERLIETGVVRVAGMDMRIRHDALADPAFLQLWLDFGPLPEKQREAMAPLLLQANFLLGTDAAFSLHPAAGHVVLSMRVPIRAGFAGKDLLHLLRSAGAEGSKMWEKTQSQSLARPTAKRGNATAKSRLMHVFHASKEQA